MTPITPLSAPGAPAQSSTPFHGSRTVLPPSTHITPSAVSTPAPPSHSQFITPITPFSLPHIDTQNNPPDVSPVLFDDSPDPFLDHSNWNSTAHIPPLDFSQSGFIPGISPYAKIDTLLATLRRDKISPVDILIQVLDPDDLAYDRYRSHLYRDDGQKMKVLLDTIMKDAAGKRKILDCMHPYLLDFACEVVREQMQTRRDSSILQGVSVVTPEFIERWNIDEEIDTTPFLTRILETAAQTEYAEAHNKIKKPQKMCRVVTRQLLYQSSNRCLGFQAEFGLFLWATGCARQTIDALFRCGLSISYDSVLNLIESLSHHCVAVGIDVSKQIHGFCYDNMNLSTSIFVEQRGSAGPAKVSSGTFGLLYKLRNALREHMLIAPMMKRFKETSGLHFNRDIKPTLPQLVSLHEQFLIVVITCLTTHTAGFEDLIKDPLLLHTIIRAIAPGEFTEVFPTRATTIEETTTRGNLLFHDDVYINQLKHTSASLSKYAIPGFHDQPTNARIRGAQLLRAKDVNAWERREVFQLGFGLFHLCLNLVWAILHTHCGSINETGSLTYFFALMEKTRLGGEHPDYHSFLAALTQVLDGLLLNAWRRECGSSTLEAFAASKPTAQQLRDIAARILTDYATPMSAPDASQVTSSPPQSSSESGESDDSDMDSPRPNRKFPPVRQLDPKRDIAHNNLRILTRDLLVVATLIRAISDGDIGRVEVLLPHLAMMFRGSGCNKYCTEILHFIHNLKHVWTPEFANIMRDNMIICISGLGPGHCMPIDLNIEHLIGYLKILLQAKGMTSPWDRLGNISAAIIHLQKIKKKVAAALETAYRNTGHTTPDTSDMPKRVAGKVASEGLQDFEDGRINNDRRKPNLRRTY
ncbi:hypothetical protein C8J57DRAFT_1075995 [Mycena rebaudengoi]|nr:hypothetical protein C8J57DRAFT_1075995 [Mycena rebaudengoi]